MFFDWKIETERNGQGIVEEGGLFLVIDKEDFRSVTYEIKKYINVSKPWESWF